MKVDTDIKYFRFDNRAAPQLGDNWGDMIPILDACLVDGFGDQVVTSIVIEDGVGTATFPDYHGYQQFQVVQFSGTGVVALHTEFKEKKKNVAKRL